MTRRFSKRIKNKKKLKSKSKEINKKNQKQKQINDLNEMDLDALFNNYEGEIAEDETETLTFQKEKEEKELPEGFEKSSLGKDSYRCIYCNLFFIYRRINRHLEAKRHWVLKKAFEEASKNPKNETSIKYIINCPNDGCYTFSDLGEKYVYCVDCKRNLINLKRVLWPHMLSIAHQNAKTGGIATNKLLKSSNKLRQSNASLVNQMLNDQEESSSSSDESDGDDLTLMSTQKDDSFIRYLELKKTFNDLIYCIYCKEHFRRVVRKRHLSLKKHALMKKKFKEAEKNKNQVVIDNNKFFGPTGCFKKSEKGDQFAYCIYCKNDFSMKRNSNLIDHTKTTKHFLAKLAAKGESNQEIVKNEEENDSKLKENPYYLNLEKCFKKSKKGDQYAFCIYCQKDLCCRRKINLVYHTFTKQHCIYVNDMIRVDEDPNDQQNQATDQTDQGDRTDQVDQQIEEIIQIDVNLSKNKEELNSDDIEEECIYSSEESDFSSDLDESSQSVATKLALCLIKKRKKRKQIYGKRLKLNKILIEKKNK